MQTLRLVLSGLCVVAAVGGGALIAACGGDDTPKTGPRPGGDQEFDCSAPAGVLPDLELRRIVSGLTRPVLAISPPGDRDRLFVVEQAGRILILKNDALVTTPFLDITSKVTRAGNEQGFLGLAFHPDYQNNGRFFVHYSTRATGELGDGDTVIAEYQRSAADPEVADTTEKVLLTVDQPFSNHNGGTITFSPKEGLTGFLYIGLGDGGAANDPQANGQNLNTLLAKILRIDVNGTSDGKPYAIPAGNMTGTDVRPEIYAYGLRNPWRMAFDPCTGDLFVGDVGQDTLEEIDVVPYGASGKNYGWRLREGENCFNPSSNCDPDNVTTAPIAQYPRSQGVSVTGGYVYRGSAIPALRGAYLYADYASGRFWSFRYENGTALGVKDITSDLNPVPPITGITSFGVDGRGELYVMNFDDDAQGDPGSLYRIEAE
jgi:glucose/arabinose dehydrogenase